MNKIPLETTGGEPVIRFRDCFSVRYIQSAALLCRLGYGIEKNCSDDKEQEPDFLLRHEVFILNSILSTVVFLESIINELYADAADGAYFYTDKKHEALLKTVGEGWRNEKNFDRAPMITKYQKILEIAGKSPFEEDDPVFSNVRDLIEIRNYLMHYRREWVIVADDRMSDDGMETQVEKFEKKLKSKFAQNPLAHHNQPWFPDKCFGHGCAEWAVSNSLLFTDAFFRKLDLPPPYEGIKDDLLTR
jgi:hypothetical protein